MAAPGETKSDLQAQIDLAQPETDPQETASLKHIAECCERHLHKLFEDEEAQEDIVKAKEGHWTSRQYAEFNLWCAKVGVHGEGLRSIDVRLKDVPEICNLLRRLLQSLQRDLNELEKSAEPCEHIISTDDNDNDHEDDPESDASSLSFDALSSAEHSEEGSAPETQALSLRKRKLALQAHIEDTIDRLHGHALRIEDAGASHRRRRVELYRQKEGPKGAYDGFKALALHKAKLQFKKASELFLDRLAESFARRRIRLEYLTEHQKKRAVDMPKQEQTLAPKSQAEPVVQGPPKKKAPENKRNITAPRRPQDQRTAYSGTVQTTLDLHPQPKRPEKAESVASVALRNPGFPPPPRYAGASFHCPYCRLEFRSREAEESCWSQHVMEDFEPYFCIYEGCDATFDVPNTFEGLLSHLQSHVDVQYHVDLPDGEHKIFDEEGFERHVAQHGNISEEMLATMKEASRRRAAFIFESCPFCGGFPDDVEKRFPDRDTPECQRELRKHIKQHMQDVALFFPPYREDIFDEDEDLKSSAVGRPRSAGQSIMEDPSEFVDRCLRVDCDCKRPSLHDAFPAAIPDVLPTLVTLWAELFPDLPRYDLSPVQDDYYLGDELLQPFVAQARGEMPNSFSSKGLPQIRLKGHIGAVRSIAFSPDGKTLASGSGDVTIRLWDAATGVPRQTIEGHRDTVHSIAFSPDGKTLASGSRDKTIRLWDTATGVPRQMLERHRHTVYSVAFSPDGETLASGSGDKTIRLWDAATGEPWQTIEGHRDAVYSIAFSPDGKKLASGSGDKAIRLWDTATGLPRQRLEGHRDAVYSIAFSPDGKTLASGSMDETIRLWETATGIPRQRLEGHYAAIWSIAFSPDGKTLASGSRDKTIRLWDAATGIPRQTLEGHCNAVYYVAFSPDGKTLALGSEDNTIRLWDIPILLY